MMAEVIRRRFSRASRLRAETGALSLAEVGADPAFEGLGDEAADAEARDESAPPTAARDAGWALPDLVIVDGGKGQLSAAVGVLRELKLGDVPVAGLASASRSCTCPAGPIRSSSPPRARASTWSSAFATRPIASRSPTTGTCAAGGRWRASSTRWRGSARPARRLSSNGSGAYVGSGGIGR
jgi:hypothetical protein